MNIVSISVDPQIDEQGGAILGRYTQLQAALESAGTTLIAARQYAPGFFLISTPELLRVLRSIPESPKEITIRVFSLKPPDKQLVGIGPEKSPLDPASYLLAHRSQG
jgi:hypothetical protein